MKIKIITVTERNAKVFRLIETVRNTPESRPHLELEETYENEEWDLMGRHEDMDTGRIENTATGRSYAYDEHRSAHAEEHQRRFANRLAQAIEGLVDRDAPDKIVLCVTAEMHGRLRSALRSEKLRSTSLEYVEKDLGKLSAAQIQDELSGLHLMPGRHPEGGFAFRPQL